MSLSDGSLEGSLGGWLTGEAIISQRKRGCIHISDYSEDRVNANSYNYRLSGQIRRHIGDLIDCRSEDVFEDISIGSDGYILEPGECYLGATVEEFGSNVFAALITGRSSLGRKLVTNHICAGLIDQGFFGRITLEIVVSKRTRVYDGMLFGQIFWFSTVGAARLYDGKYQGQGPPTSSRMHLDGQ
jgi:dCTP deaminase